jgi:hypothetical protein
MKTKTMSRSFKSSLRNINKQFTKSNDQFENLNNRQRRKRRKSSSSDQKLKNLSRLFLATPSTKLNKRSNEHFSSLRINPHLHLGHFLEKLD